MFKTANRVARLYLPILVVASAAVAATPSALGDDTSISYVSTFRNISNEQIGNGSALILNGTFFSADLFSTVPNAYTSASVTLPGGSSINLPEGFPADYGFQTGLLDQASLDAMFPTGTYTFTGNNGAQTDTATLNYSADDYSQTLPYLTGTTYSDLQGLNASQNFTFNVSPFVPGGNQTAAYMFLTIFNQSTGAAVFTQGFLSPSTTSIALNGGTLVAGTSYSYELDYSDRDIGTDTGGAEFPPQVGFDLRTDGTFTTAAAPIPEPSSLILLGTGLLAGVAGVRRRLA